MEYTVMLTWDPESAVWIATSEDVPGLVLESGSLDGLIERVRFAIPDLIALNQTERAISLCFRSERHERIELYG